MSSVYLRLLIFLLEILIPAWASSRPAFFVMYSFPNLDPGHYSISCCNCCFLTFIHVYQMADKAVWYPYLFKNFPQFVAIHTVKGFNEVNEAEVDIYLEFSCFFYDQTDVGNLISGSSAFSKSSLNIWKFSVHVLSKPTLENFEHYFASVWNECNCVVCWTFFGIALLWDWNENWLLPCANFTSSVCM